MDYLRRQSFRSRLKIAFLAVILLSVLMTGGLSYYISAATLEKNALKLTQDIKSVVDGLTAMSWEEQGIRVAGVSSNGEEGLRLITEMRPKRRSVPVCGCGCGRIPQR